MKNKYYPILPLRDIVVYPNIIVPLFIGRKSSIAALDAATADNQELLLMPQKDASINIPQLEDINRTGVLGRIVQTAKLSDGTIKALVEGISRITLDDPQEKDGHFISKTKLIEEKNSLSKREEKSSISVAIEAFSDYLKYKNRNQEEIIETLKNLSHCGHIADTIAAHMELDIHERIKLLEQKDAGKRIEKLLVYLETAKEQNEEDQVIKDRVKRQMERNQKEYYLNEKIKAIQKELGDMDEVQNESEQLEAKILEAKMPDDAEKKCLAELNKLKQMSAMSAEANVIRSYLEWMINFPWSKQTEVKYDLARAEKILNRDHHGLFDVKERILEHLAVKKRNKNGRSPIICLVGPPGVGKTSLGKSIAESTGRDFDRISLGGVHDEAEIRGHRRTYIGALPGKIVQKLCKLESNNPLILLDEIDKIGADHRGDPASALLEVLDPAQNNKFNDHYLESDVDLSNVLFITTANSLNIPGPLLDRMEVIRLPGYTTKEKVQIASQYLLPRQREEHALKKSEFKISEKIIELLIENYTREAGVRNLERELNKIARKVVRKLEDGTQKSVTITNKNIHEYLGVAKFQRNEENLKAKVGVVTGLAWTSVGGELLQIEATAFKGKGKLIRTGQLGDVMQESIQTALSVVRDYLDKKDSSFKFDQYDIHMHLPEGATPKDGPSAGIGMATTLLSALTNEPVKGDLAMTGEITLHGNVLPIGGLKEKLIAAQRGYLSTVLIPKNNMKDLQDIPDDVKKSLNIIPVSHINDVIAHAFAKKNPVFKAN